MVQAPVGTPAAPGPYAHNCRAAEKEDAAAAGASTVKYSRLLIQVGIMSFLQSIKVGITSHLERCRSVSSKLVKGLASSL